MSLEKIFNDFKQAKSLFVDRNILSISFTPDKIPHRKKQIEDLGKILAPALIGSRPSNVFVYGRTGTGKSLISCYVTNELMKAAQNKIKTVYINCKLKKVADTEYRVLATIIKELGKDVPFTGLPTDRIYKIFLDMIDSEKQILILVIDEIDALVQKTGDEIIYNLTRINQELKNAKICLIGITNNLSFVNTLDTRVKSSLSEEELIFPPYNASQIKDILKQRADVAFSDGVIGEGVIGKCSALAAQEHGDARRALDLLRVAGELAERSGSIKVTTEHVDMAEDKINVDKFVEIVKTQPKQSQVVMYTILELIDGKNEVLTGDVLKSYQKNCVKYRLKPLTQRRVSDLIAELDMFGIISTKNVSRGRYGRTRIINIMVDETVKEKMKKVLYEVLY